MLWCHGYLIKGKKLFVLSEFVHGETIFSIIHALTQLLLEGTPLKRLSYSSIPEQCRVRVGLGHSDLCTQFLRKIEIECVRANSEERRWSLYQFIALYISLAYFSDCHKDKKDWKSRFCTPSDANTFFWLADSQFVVEINGTWSIHFRCLRRRIWFRWDIGFLARSFHISWIFTRLYLRNCH